MKGKEKGKERDREGSRGEWSPGYGWIMRPEAGGEAVWEVAGLSEFTVRSPNQEDSGHFHYSTSTSNIRQPVVCLLSTQEYL